MASKQDRAGLLAQVRNPLIFFSLALVIIEGIFGFVVVYSKMTGDQQFHSLWIMTGLFVLVVGAVILITVKWPEHLYEKVAEDLAASRTIREFISSKGFRDSIEDVVQKYMKAQGEKKGGVE